MRNRKKKSSTENKGDQPETIAEETSSNVKEEPQGTEAKVTAKPQRSCLGKCVRYIIYTLLFVLTVLVVIVLLEVSVVPRIIAEIQVSILLCAVLNVYGGC